MSFGFLNSITEEPKTLPLTKSQAESMANEMTEARMVGALFHATNPFDSWYCTDCGVFGKGGDVCWCCDSKEIKRRWVPRFGGGTQTQIFDENLETGSFFPLRETRQDTQSNRLMDPRNASSDAKMTPKCRI